MTVSILDHTYQEIGRGTVRSGVSNGQNLFSTPLYYESTVTQGTVSKSPTEEGIVALYTYNGSSRLITTAVIVKVLLHA